MMTRRDALILGGAASAALLLTRFPALAQGTVPVGDLAVAGPLGDVWLGPETAKCTIIEYASLTCSHCASFHSETYPALKERYVDKGLVRFTLREFPLDPLATAGFMLARADGNGKYYAITDLLFDQQRGWAFTDKPLDALGTMMRQAGFSKERFEATLKDQKLYDAVNAVKNRAFQTLKVESTPTFFINGARHAGALTIDELEKVIKPIVGA